MNKQPFAAPNLSYRGKIDGHSLLPIIGILASRPQSVEVQWVSLSIELSCSFELSYLTDNGPVAQLDRASVFGTEGWGFDSLRGRQIRTATQLAPPISPHFRAI
jgi:hypothetical protein